MQLILMQDRVMYRQDQSDSFLVYPVQQNELIMHQYKMMTHNTVPGIVSLTQYKYDDQWEIRFNITGLISLDVFLARKQPTSEMMANCLLQVLNTIESSSRYLLDSNRFVFDLAHAYIDLNTMCVSLLYFPLVKVVGPANQEMNAFLQDMLYAYKGDLTNEFSSFCNHINHRLRDPGITIKELRAAIEALISCEQKPEACDIEQMTRENEPIKPQNQSSEPTGRGIQSKPKSLKDAPLGYHASTKACVNKGIKLSPLGFTAILNILLCVLLVLSWQKFIGFTGSPINSVLSIIFLGLPLNYFVYKSLNQKNLSQTTSKNTSKTVNQSKERRMPLKRERSSQTLPHTVPSILERQSDPSMESLKDEGKVEPAKTPISAISNRQWVEEANGIRVVQGQTNPTEVLKKSSVGHARLVDREKAVEVLVKTNRFIIGRQPDLTDLTLSDTTVGRIHAEIKYSDQCYRLSDLNSKNGTFINGLRLTCNMPHQLKSGDCIQFSKKIFHFEMD